LRNVPCLVIELEQGPEAFGIKPMAGINRVEIFGATVI
jgi:hypothetical protein